MPDPVFERRQAIYAKVEATPGVNANPSPATDGVLCVTDDIQLTPLDQETEERTLVRPFFGAFHQLIAANWVRATIPIECAGFGTAGPASPTPGYDALLRSGAMQRAVSPGTNVAFSPVSTNLETVTLAWNQDGRIHVMVGAVAENVRWVYEQNRRPRLVFDMHGAYVDVADSPLSIPDVSAYQEPLTVGSVNTTAFSLHGYPACMARLEIVKANTVSRRNLVNCEQHVHVANSQTTGSVEMEGVRVADFDWFARIKSGQLGALALTHGITAGNIVEHAAGNVQIINPGRRPVDDIEHMTADLIFEPGAAGNDEHTFIVR